ncbi:oxidoreductase [Salinigranum rubrum]|uniref:Oxidoreductase n=1 Tax=Salinigranum rubrum TaxID=755307 RepID=A0A2I8VNW1_9EURY|nr:FAD-dependent monooxygenase [Salinigranum rubrum]AUV83611.1 oxidoreductase [Salinigranum rubrum]
MTLSTIPGYDGTRVSERGDHAVVVGAGMAGLFAARVLADAFESVTVLDRDSLPDEPTARRGVPQGPHPHALLEAGRATMADLLPGCVEDVVAGGGVVTDFTRGVDFYNEGDFLAEGPVSMETVSATRPLFEHVVRRHVAAHDGVSLRTNCLCTEYCLDDAGTTVEGVVVRSNTGSEELPADLVVDASGRTSRTPAWLETHGYAPPSVDEVTIDVAYSTAFLDRPAGDTRTYLVPPSAPRTRGGMAAPVDGDRWIVNLSGVHGETPPTDREGFAGYAARLPVPELARLVDEHEWTTEGVHSYRFPSNRRHRYETLDRFPEGLLVVGDAVASFNPVYAQGMSVAALEALVLHHALASDSTNLPGRFFDRAASVVDIAWSLAVGADFGFPETRGQKPRGTAFFNWYLGRLLRHAHTDGRLTDAFVRVLTMERPPTSLLRPRIAWRVLRPTR